MSINPRKALFASICTLVLVASGAYPAWSSIHEAQDYGAEADLSLQPLVMPTEPVPGEDFTASVIVRNEGPGRADWPKVNVALPDGMLLTSTVGCTESPAPATRCVMAPLESNESRAVVFQGVTDGSARGPDVIGAFVTSEVNDSNPANDSVFQVLDWIPQVDVSVQLLNEQPENLPSGGFRYRVEVRNDGPSAAVQMDLSVSGSQQQIGCTATGGANCIADQFGYVGMPAHSTIVLTLDFPPFDEAYGYHYAGVWAYTEEWNLAESWSATIQYEAVIFQGGFEW